MNYQETLARMVENSGLTLKDLADKCKEFGVKVDPSYISKLQTGKQSPASDDINVAIANACGEDPDKLLYSAYIDKAPDFIKEFINKLLNYLRETTKAIIDNYMPKEIAGNIFDNIDDLYLIKAFLIQDQGVPDLKDNFFMVQDSEDEKMKILLNDLFSINMPDDSMEPIINKGAKLQFEKSEIKSGDIVISVLKDNSYIVRRYITFDSKVLLVAENSSYEPMIFDKENITIVGRAKSITVEL